MKIKSINDFTLAECQEYLDTNSNGELAQEVAQRMEYLRQLKERKLQQDRARRINEFNTEFNRYYATQRYEDAFAICLKYINNIDDKTVVLFLTALIAAVIIELLGHEILYPICYDGDYWDYTGTELFYNMLIIGILCSLVFLFLWLRTYIKMHKEPRLLLRRIANIVIDNLQNNKIINIWNTKKLMS